MVFQSRVVAARRMPSASQKSEKQAPPGVPESFSQALSVVEKKARNLEKRKGKLDQYRDLYKSGKELNDDQKSAIQKYNEVVHSLEIVRDMQKQFAAINAETLKVLKKQWKREMTERKQHEVALYRELLQVQDLLANMGGDDVRQDFLHGRNRACVLSEENLNQLDGLYKMVSPSREPEEGDTGLESFAQQVAASAEHIYNLIEARPKGVLDTTYKDLRAVLTSIADSHYFDTEGASEEAAAAAAVAEGETKEEEEEEEEEEAAEEEGQQQEQQPQQETAGARRAFDICYCWRWMCVQCC
ncbi:PREDICTED: caprin-1-like [Priapulus caudatus]|uniref:Caprin-1-like n=1 Tax=Priapulus caudatus TaxID=37621 RepID=A0ABM1FBI3_PRICU|nr:PREDICTED: caprin-1-like [Priapulus caudatus]